MGVVDDVRNSFERGRDVDTYTVSETIHEGDDHIGTFHHKTLRELVEEHPDACRAFKMISGAGYEDPNKDTGNVSQAEHSGRVEIDPSDVLDDLLTESCSCRVRLDTSNPQLVTAVGNNTKQIEIDDAVARFIPSTSDS